jgi:predicted AlkP superfamily phosphohydrolase/phosphomutase/Flp pilus assembly protein TadD
MRRFSRFLVLVLAAAGCRGSKEAGGGASKPVAPAPIAAVETEDAARARRPEGRSRGVIWIGLDGLDLELVDRFAGAGRMPHWKRLSDEGYVARLESELPLLSPILWTTQATGMPPDLHRVLDFQEVDPSSGRKVPISGYSRAVPAVWNLASAAGRRVGVVGWWASHPAEEVNGYFVSDHASPILFDHLALEGAAFPTSLSPGIGQVAARDGHVAAEDLTSFLAMPVPEIRQALEAGGGMESPVVALSRILGATRVTQRIARGLYDGNPPDLAAVYFEGTDEVGHVFAPYTPPRLSCTNLREDDVLRFEHAVETYYEVVDRILGQWMRRAEEDGAVLLVTSDHGFKWGSDRPCGFAAGGWSTAAFWHRRAGVFAAWGAGVAPAPETATRPASLFDVAPTILALLGLPADPRMPGTLVLAAFPGLPVPPRAKVPSEVAVRRVAAAVPSAEESNEYAKKLLALGYLTPGDTQSLQPTGGDRPAMTEGAWNNLGVYLQETRKDLPGARAAFEKSLELRPDYYSPMFNLATLYRSLGDSRRAEDWFFRSLAGAGGEPASAVAGWAREYERDGKRAAARSLLDRAVRAYPENEPIARERALLLHRAKDCRGAVAALSAFEASTTDPETLNDLALFETCLADRDAVERLLTRSLSLKPDQPQVVRILEVVRRAAPPR